jgi:hypothetical protein
MGEMGIACTVLVGTPEARLMSRIRWVDNIRMDLGETGWGGKDRIHLAQDRDEWRAL